MRSTGPAARYDLVRVGIGSTASRPPTSSKAASTLRPALSVKARVSHVKTVPAGARLSYGLRYETDARDTHRDRADRLRRRRAARARRSAAATAIVRGRRCPIAGTVTMDQLMVDVGDLPVEVGDEVVLIGRQGDEEITAAEWARAMGTIAYKIVCGIGRACRACTCREREP